jgi:hypothetical protein
MPDTEAVYGRGDLMVVGAFRYHMGRKTYAVGDCADWLIGVWPTLRETTRHLIQRELDSAIKEDDADRAAGREVCRLGMDCDRADWLRVAALWRA